MIFQSFFVVLDMHSLTFYKSLDNFPIVRDYPILVNFHVLQRFLFDFRFFHVTWGNEHEALGHFIGNSVLRFVDQMLFLLLFFLLNIHFQGIILRELLWSSLIKHAHEFSNLILLVLRLEAIYIRVEP